MCNFHSSITQRRSCAMLMKSNVYNNNYSNIITGWTNIKIISSSVVLSNNSITEVYTIIRFVKINIPMNLMLVVHNMKLLVTLYNVLYHIYIIRFFIYTWFKPDDQQLCFYMFSFVSVLILVFIDRIIMKMFIFVRLKLHT
jgi:hypothetical protein